MNELFLFAPIAIPIIAGLIHYPIKFKTPARRNLYVFLSIMISSITVWLLALYTPETGLEIVKFTKDLTLSLKLDGAGKIFACLSATLWPLTALYAFEYMEHENHLHMFYTFFIMSFGATMGIAMADNILTMYLFYEIMTLFTIPLVMHGMTHKHRKATRKYMIFSIGGAAFAFPGVAYLILNGANNFVLGGHSYHMAESDIGKILFLIAFIGFGVKAAVFPVHSWLPTASVAPTPVTALLHAVAVVKAGAFAIIRLTYYSYGPEAIQGTWVQYAVMMIAAFTIVFGSTMATRQTHFKRRLAYSTIANLSYIVFAATLMTNAGLLAAFLHLIFHSVIKISAFFAAGSVLHKTQKEYIHQFDGIGKEMPLTFIFYTISALALTGIPPLCGFVSKWSIATAATETDNIFALIGVVALLISALLTAIYTLTPTLKAFFPAKGTVALPVKKCEAGPFMLIPMGLCAVASIIFGLFSGQIANLLQEVIGI